MFETKSNVGLHSVDAINLFRFTNINHFSDLQIAHESCDDGQVVSTYPVNWFAFVVTDSNADKRPDDKCLEGREVNPLAKLISWKANFVQLFFGFNHQVFGVSAIWREISWWKKWWGREDWTWRTVMMKTELN